ncbi:adenosylcobinamide-phosphate synthase CbiB [Aurantimonas sp. 22II-16-19i]|uniref:adenosylcobinamide-phosphate synthase CbiB n=1 Tax=Aurantimonas sp. 22II-16-19i TaxID=1317114 RepID=UPI0009F7AA7A|nr:adenosylcobinamide-phosphate synthase CbiB [Aurantimonas sp. 22II-16-19i]ORE94782.1 cobalamin biosynthesis protein [Aurantimonas sp. 22II-16-19i]
MIARLAILLAALVLDRLIGDPPWLWRRLPHPVTVIGQAIDSLDRRLNREAFTGETRRRSGFFALGLLLLGALILGGFVSALADALGLLGMIGEAAIVAVFLAHKSLVDHVRAVGTALRDGGLAEGRRAVAMIVGRDPEQLDRPAVIRAAIESLAENASDGVVAPAFWYLIFGLPGLLAYKVVNTADSMIGHMDARYRDFGFASAKLDDLMNVIPARATAGLFALAARLGGLLPGGGRRPAVPAPSVRAIMATTRRDARLHRSPNAGWPETAMAAALGLALGGPRRYRDLIVDAPMLNADGRRSASLEDLANAIRLFDRAMGIMLAVVVVALLAGLPV